MYGRGDDGLLMRCLKPLDERVSLKLLMRVWGPRFEFAVRLILVATFLDDSFRAATHFSQHTEQVGEQGYLASLAESSPDLVRAIAMVVLGIGLLAQSLGSLCLLALIQPDGAIKALIGWAIAQPVLYAQLANKQFVAQSLTLVGGLLILRAHLSEQAKRDGRRVPLGDEAAIARTHLFGRLLLPAVYIYHAGLILSHAGSVLLGNQGRRTPLLRLLHRSDHSLSMFTVDTLVLVGLMLGCMLVAAGLKSRTVALTLALVNLGAVCYQHPFFRYAWLEGGEWQYDEDAMRKWKPQVALPNDASPKDLEPWLLFDLHRYYYFLGLSTSGALLLLAQFGPGDLAVEKDEVILGDIQVVGRD